VSVRPSIPEEWNVQTLFHILSSRMQASAALIGWTQLPYQKRKTLPFRSGAFFLLSSKAQAVYRSGYLPKFDSTLGLFSPKRRMTKPEISIR
jgi:hypothetical protein